MPVITTSVTKEHFKRFGEGFPKDWEVRHLTENSSERYVKDLSLAAEKMIEYSRGADFLLVNSVYPVTAAVAANIPTVRFIQVQGVGYNKVDVEAAAKARLPVATCKGANSRSVAELVIAMIIALLRRVVSADREVKEGRFLASQSAWRALGCREISDSSVGILGFGDIGRDAARLLAPFSPKKIYYHDIVRADASTESELKAEYLSFKELFAASDVLTIHVPLTKLTANFVRYPELSLMRQGSILINTSRGEVLDSYACAKALREGCLGALGLDVYAPEPPDKGNNPLLALPQELSDKLLLTPHIAGTTDISYRNMMRICLENMRNALKGKPLKCVVNDLLYARLP